MLVPDLVTMVVVGFFAPCLLCAAINLKYLFIQ